MYDPQEALEAIVKNVINIKLREYYGLLPFKPDESLRSQELVTKGLPALKFTYN